MEKNSNNNHDDWVSYIRRLEEILVREVQRGVLGQIQSVPIFQRLRIAEIAGFLGEATESTEPLAIDYYGYIKKSRGLLKLVTEIPGQVKSVNAPVVHFSALRLEMLARLDLELVPRFAEFKKTLLDIRGFNHKYVP